METSLSKSESKEKRQGQEKVPIENILVPIDGSENSMRAARYAIEIAKLQRAQIVCIHIIDKLPYGFEFSGSCIDQHLQDVQGQCKVWFNKVIQMAENEGIKNIKTEFIRDIRSIVDAIVNYASHNSIDLIVLGTRGRRGIQKVLLGSVANGVSQHAHCPVLLVK
jgi:nucleotide-binding universal stress UspA family protein